MDSSAAGRPPGMPPVDAWARQVPTPSATVVARAQSVRPAKDSKELRDKQKQPDRKRPGSRKQPDPETAAPGSPDPDARLGAPHLLLQAVDPDTGYVYWQGTLPAVRPTATAAYGPPAPHTPRDTSPAVPALPDSPNSSELLGRRAYDHHDDDTSPHSHVERTA